MLELLLIIIVISVLFGNKGTSTTSRNNRSVKPRAKSSQIRQPVTAVLPKTQPVVIPEGRILLDVYTYDGRPIDCVPDHSVIAFNIIARRRKMKSIYTGTEWTEAYALAFNGALIGFMFPSAMTSHIRAIVNKHRNVVVHGMKDGLDPRGWPIVRLLLPEREWFLATLKQTTREAVHWSSRECLVQQRVNLLWQLKAICNQTGEREYQESVNARYRDQYPNRKEL